MKNEIMKKMFKIVITGVFLLAIEYFVLLLSMQTEYVVRYSVPLENINGAFRDANEISLMRVIFYFPLWVACVFFMYEKLNIEKTLLKLAAFNCSLYVLISFFMTIFFPFAIEFFVRPFFIYLIGATFISPFILSIMPLKSDLGYRCRRKEETRI